MANSILDTKGVALTESGLKILQGVELLGARMDRLFFVELGGMLGNPRGGSLVPSMFFDPEDEQTASAMVDEVQTLIASNEDQVDINTITVGLVHGDDGKNGIEIQIDADITDTPVSKNLSFFGFRDLSSATPVITGKNNG